MTKETMKRPSDGFSFVLGVGKFHFLKIEFGQWSVGLRVLWFFVSLHFFDSNLFMLSLIKDSIVLNSLIKEALGEIKKGLSNGK